MRVGRLLAVLLAIVFMAFPHSSIGIEEANITDMSMMIRARQEVVSSVRDALARARTQAMTGTSVLADTSDAHAGGEGMAWADCVQLYEDSEHRLGRLVGEYKSSDARAWLSGAMACHMTCVDGLLETNASVVSSPSEQSDVTTLLRKALALHAQPLGPHHQRRNKRGSKKQRPKQTSGELSSGLLASWSPSAHKADMVVAKDGSGNYKTIGEAVSALGQWQQRGNKRVVIYIKSGLYSEHIEIDRHMRNVMLIGDGMDKTIITGSRNVLDGSTTYQSATFGVSGDGFWARDMTFQNTAGPAKHQAVALRVASDLSLFYRCSIKGYQDTLFVHSLRQFYRDCDIYGTIDFIFGDAAVVLQNCNIHVRKPMAHQANMVTAQGRQDPNQNTGISVHGSRVLPAREFEGAKGSISSYLGRPWKKYSRTVFLSTTLDGLIHPKGWADWRGGFALDTLYYGEYMNTGAGAVTSNRVNWPGFHVLRDQTEADPFAVANFIQGQSWIPETGVPCSLGL